jgi:hypothetical protein
MEIGGADFAQYFFFLLGDGAQFVPNEIDTQDTSFAK